MRAENNVVNSTVKGRDPSGLLHIPLEYLHRAMRALIAIKLLLLPLIFDPYNFSVFDVPKTALSHALAWLLAAILVITLLQDSWRPQQKLVHLFVAGFIASALLSTLLAKSQYIAFFGYPFRYLGFTTLADMGLLYTAIVFTVRKPQDTRFIVWSLMGGAILSSAYGLLQYSKLDPLIWGGQLAGRIFSTFGNPDFYGQYLSVLAVALMALVIFHPLQRHWKTLLIVLFFAVLYLIGAVGTRSALIGIGAGVLSIIILWVRREKCGFKKMRHMVFFLLAGLGGIGALLSQTLLTEKLSWYWIRRGLEQRGLIYETALRLFADHPIFGVGPDNIGVLFFQYRPLRELSLRGLFFLDSSAHSWPLQILTTQGIVGFMIFLIILFITARTVWRLIRTPYGTFVLIVAAGLAAHFGSGLLTPGSQSTEWIGWTGIGFLAAFNEMAVRGKSSQVPVPSPSKTVKWLWLPVFIIALSGMGFSLRAYVADRFSSVAIELFKNEMDDKDRFMALNAAIKGTQIDPGRADHWQVRGNAEENAGNLYLAAASYEEAARRAPYAPENWWNIARVNMRLFQAGDSTRKEAVLYVMEQALKSDPHGSESYSGAAKVTIVLGENEQALAWARKAISLFPKKDNYYILAATAAHRLGRPEEAENILKTGLSAYSEDAIKLGFVDPLHLALAQLYLELGQIKKSEAEISFVLEKDPNNAEALTFVEKLKNLKR